MKKYTIIYSESSFIGSHRTIIVRKRCIECDPVNFVGTVEESIGWGNVNFAFEGECKDVESV